MNTPRILLVEDDDIIAGFIEHTLAEHRIEVIRAADAESGWRVLQESAAEFGTLLLDRQLPGMDGMSLLRKIKDAPGLRHIPVVMETADDGVDSIREGLAAGAYYYLTKPLQPELLLAVVNAALAQHIQFVENQTAIRQVSNAMRFLDTGIFHCRTLAETRDLAYGLAHSFPDPQRVVLGLQELLANAVEHGNLAISYTEKTRFVLEGCWAEEVTLRLAQPRLSERRVTAALARDAQDITLTISDQGEGFAWQKYLDFDPERAFDPHGRGIAMARMLSFDSLEYQGNGNTVVLKVALVQCQQEIETTL